MGIVGSFFDAAAGSLADQWVDIVTSEPFDEHTVVAPGVYRERKGNRGQNTKHTDGVLTDGSKILVPENTAAVIFKQAGIEAIIADPGEYEYESDEKSAFGKRPEGKSFLSHALDTVVDQTMDRIAYGGIPKDETRISFVNLREIRSIRFGTRGPQVYNDRYYRCDLEVFAYGTFSLKVIDAERFVRNFVPANLLSYSFDDERARSQLVGEFLQSFTVALNALSSECRIAELPSQAARIARDVTADEVNVGTWPERFGIELVRVGIENIEFSEESREMVRRFTERRMDVAAYEDVSQRASNMAAQQKIASGIQENGLGDGAGMLFGMNLAQSLDTNAKPAASTSSIDEQIATLRKLKELVDMGILTQEEFDAKKREIMGR